MRKINIKVAAVLVCLAVAICAFAFWPAKNAFARYRVKQILLSDTTSAEQIAALKPYVQIGDSYFAVAARLAPKPETASKRFIRPTEFALGLGGVNLALAIRTDGTIAGIGRYRHDRDLDGTVWFAGYGEKWWDTTVALND